MKRPKQKTDSRKKLTSNLNDFRELYTKAVYSIMEIRHAMGDANAEWSHPELIEKIKKLKELEPKESAEQPEESLAEDS
jgi:hypothetical protein|tara:strand:- start:152 stop:388 length:237 start_codon:yes stop_codon:yes gene_type:complete